MTTNAARNNSPEHAAHSEDRKKRYFKAGTAERLWRDLDPFSGEQLSFEEKSYASFLISICFSTDHCVRDTETNLCAMANTTPKTFRKWTDRLAARKLIAIRHLADDNRKVYDLTALFERYGEERPAPGSPKVIAIDAPTGKVYRTTKADLQRVASARFGKVSKRMSTHVTEPVRESDPIAPGNNTGPVQESLPNATVTSSSSSSSPTQRGVTPLAQRLGLIEDTKRIYERELAIADAALTDWTVSKRRQRELFQRFGLETLFGAIGYVLQQIQLHPGTIENPAGLLVFALTDSRSALMPEHDVALEILSVGKHYRTTVKSKAREGPVPHEPAKKDAAEASDTFGNSYRTDRSETPRERAAQHPSFDLAIAQLEHSLAPQFFGMLVQPARLLSVEGSCFVIGYETSFVKELAVTRVGDTIANAIRLAAGEDASVRFVVIGEPNS